MHSLFRYAEYPCTIFDRQSSFEYPAYKFTDLFICHPNLLKKQVCMKCCHHGAHTPLRSQGVETDCLSRASMRGSWSVMFPPDVVTPNRAILLKKRLTHCGERLLNQFRIALWTWKRHVITVVGWHLLRQAQCAKLCWCRWPVLGTIGDLARTTFP